MKRKQLFVILIALIVALVVNLAIVGLFSTAHAQDTEPHDCYTYVDATGSFRWIPCPVPGSRLRPARGYYPIAGR